MASVVGIAGPDGQITDARKVADQIKGNIRQAREHRKQFEAGWQASLAFAAGQHWLVESPRGSRSLRHIGDVDPRYKRRELYQGDQITEIRTHVLGELGSDDDRPELLLQRDDQSSEDYQAQLNRALGFGWDFEFDGDGALDETDRNTVDLGTAGIQCYFDPTQGGAMQQGVPHLNGQPIFDQQEAYNAVAASMLGGPRVEHRDIPSGRICWRPLSAFNILPPPGVTHERYFPWECIVFPAPIQTVQAQYGETAANLRPDGDISSTLGTASVGSTSADRRKGTLKNHVWLFLYYERPTPQSPQGRVWHFGGNNLELLRVDNQLPYKGPQGEYRSGIAYFHWWRVTGRFWSRSLIDACKDGQRAYDKRRTQINEMIDRGLPYTLVQTGSQARKRTDLPFELVEIDRTEQQPVHVSGFTGGQWMYDELRQIQDDLERASGVRMASLGENPANVQNYSQLALLREADQVKRSVIYRGRKLAIKQLVEDSVYDMRTYWGPQKQIMLAGDDDAVEAATFNATQIPAFFIVKVAKGESKPRSQAAEIQKVKDILDYAAQTAQPLPVDWAAESYERGQVADLPEAPADWQGEQAERENHQLLQGIEQPVAYYDDPAVHIPLHRASQNQARAINDKNAWLAHEAHIQEHLNQQQELAAQFQATQVPQPIPGPGPAVPSQGASSNGQA